MINRLRNEEAARTASRIPGSRPRLTTTEWEEGTICPELVSKEVTFGQWHPGLKYTHLQTRLQGTEPNPAGHLAGRTSGQSYGFDWPVFTRVRQRIVRAILHQYFAVDVVVLKLPPHGSPVANPGDSPQPDNALANADAGRQAGRPERDDQGGEAADEAVEP